jgi:hypothetical protein
LEKYDLSLLKVNFVENDVLVLLLYSVFYGTPYVGTLVINALVELNLQLLRTFVVSPRKRLEASWVNHIDISQVCVSDLLAQDRSAETQVFNKHVG